MKHIIFVLTLCVCAFARAQAASHPSFVPILFVHGTGMTSGTWNEMRAHLLSKGYPRDYLLAVDLLPRDGDNVRAARRYIEPAVEKLLHAAREMSAGRAANKVDIVAHSMGAVSARWFAVKMQPERVRTLITLAGANHGTNALCGYPGYGERQMCPAFATRSVQSDLNGAPDVPRDETPYGVGEDPQRVNSVPPDSSREILYVTLRIEPDEWIVPADSALLSGAGGIEVPFRHEVFRQTSSGNWLYSGDADHDLLPRDAAVIEWAAVLLSR